MNISDMSCGSEGNGDDEGDEDNEVLDSIEERHD